MTTLARIDDLMRLLRENSWMLGRPSGAGSGGCLHAALLHLVSITSPWPIWQVCQREVLVESVTTQIITLDRCRYSAPASHIVTYTVLATILHLVPSNPHHCLIQRP